MELNIEYVFFLISYSIYGCAGSSLLCRLSLMCSLVVFPNCSLVVFHRLLIAVAFLAAAHGRQGTWASVVAACGLSCYGSRALEHRLNSCGARAQLLHSMWDPPGSGLNLDLLHWQADSLPLSYQGIPEYVFIYESTIANRGASLFLMSLTIIWNVCLLCLPVVCQ